MSLVDNGVEGKLAEASPALDQEAAQPGSQALISRTVDFWLLGGASILFWLFCHFLEILNPHSASANGFINDIPALFAFFTLIINGPHFLASYHLAYSRGWGFIRYHWFQLIAVPGLLAVALIMGDIMFGLNITAWTSFGYALNQWLAPLGIFLVIGAYPSFGGELIHQLATLMYLTVGWHYTKQVFGCFMVYSRFDGYSLSSEERNLVKASLLSVWGFNFFSINSAINKSQLYSATSISHVFPETLYQFFEIFTVVLFVLVAYRIFYQRYQKSDELPPAAAVVAWLAMFVWWMPFARSETFFLFAVPLFHGLQYLPFYKKVIDAQHIDPSTSTKSFTYYFCFLIAAAFLAFHLGPEIIDSWRETESRFEMAYWLVGAVLFINIHHFFIDNTLWRLRDERVRRWLLG